MEETREEPKEIAADSLAEEVSARPYNSEEAGDYDTTVPSRVEVDAVTQEVRRVPLTKDELAEIEQRKTAFRSTSDNATRITNAIAALKPSKVALGRFKAGTQTVADVTAAVRYLMVRDYAADMDL